MDQLWAFLRDAVEIGKKPWDRKTTLEKASVGMWALFIVAFVGLPYDTYIAVRALACLCLYFFVVPFV